MEEEQLVSQSILKPNWLDNILSNVSIYPPVKPFPSLITIDFGTHFPMRWFTFLNNFVFPFILQFITSDAKGYERKIVMDKPGSE